MKARTARIYYLAVFAVAFVGVAVFSAIIAVSAVFPFAFTAVRDFLTAKLSMTEEKRISAANAAKAKKAALKKEQAKLNKDKKKLQKKQKKALDKRVKRIYEERMASGYEASLGMVDAAKADLYSAPVSAPAAAPAKPEKKVAKKPAKKAAEPKPVVAPEPIPVQPAVEPHGFDFGHSDDDYTANGSMFRGISF